LKHIFTKIPGAAFKPISFCQKITTQTVSKEKFWQALLHENYAFKGGFLNT